MNVAKTALFIIGTLVFVGVGFWISQKTAGSPPSSVQQVHLTCWNDSEEAAISRVRLVLDSARKGLAWISDFEGQPQSEGTLAPAGDENNPDLLGVTFESKDGSFSASIPRFVFQPHVKSLQITIQSGEGESRMECRKINLQSANRTSSAPSL